MFSEIISFLMKKVEMYSKKRTYVSQWRNGGLCKGGKNLAEGGPQPTVGGLPANTQKKVMK